MILLWVLAYGWQLHLGTEGTSQLFQSLGLRPAGFVSGWRDLAGGDSWWQRMAGGGDCVLPLITYQFLHGGPLHLLGNALFLWVFGGRLEARAGALRMLIFTLVCGMAAGLLQVQGNPTSWTPTIGASGAVAGNLAAYLLFYRRARILLLIPVIIVPVFVEIPVVLLVLVFFVLQLPPAQGLFSMGSNAPVAYLAHLGGLGAGILLAPTLRRRRRPRNVGPPSSSHSTR